MTKDGFIEGYNAQAAVDEAKQINVAHGLDAEHERSVRSLFVLVDAVRANLETQAQIDFGGRGLLR